MNSGRGYARKNLLFFIFHRFNRRHPEREEMKAGIRYGNGQYQDLVAYDAGLKRGTVTELFHRDSVNSTNLDFVLCAKHDIGVGSLHYSMKGSQIGQNPQHPWDSGGS